MLTVTRLSKNTDGDTLRIDTITMTPTNNGTFQRFDAMTFQRLLKTETIIGPADRDVASVELVTNGDSYESSTGNYLWVKWSTHPYCQCDMSDLPRVGDTI